MKRFLLALLLLVPLATHAANMGVAPSTNWLANNINPHANNTNYFTPGDTGVVDGSAAIWNWSPLNTPSGTNYVGSVFASGAWQRIPMGGTNTFFFATTQTNFTLIGRTNVTVTQVTAGTNVTIYIDASGGGGTTINPTDGYLPYRANATTFGDSFIIHGLDPETSVMGTIVTNDNFAVVNGANWTHLSHNSIESSGTLFVAGSNFGGLQLASGDGAGSWLGRWDLAAISGDLFPASSDAYNFGTSTLRVLGSYVSQANVFTNQTVYGYYDNAHPTNFSGIVTYVTNGVAVFDFQNGGAGPAPTRISFRTNGVEVGHFP